MCIMPVVKNDNAICSKANTCPKMLRVMDKDLLDFQYSEVMQDVCAKCKDKK